MTRVVGGAAKGHRLAVPAGSRPTGDRAREALFSMLEASRGPWSGTRVLDLYAGSGALGLEALSRGASVVDLVESDKDAVTTIRANLEGVARATGPSVAHVHRQPVERWLSRPPTGTRDRYDVVFCDPPYATSVAAVLGVLGALGQPGPAGWLADDAVVVLERASRDPAWEWPAGYEALRDRRYGEAHLWIAGWGGGRGAETATPQ